MAVTVSVPGLVVCFGKKRRKGRMQSLSLLFEHRMKNCFSRPLDPSGERHPCYTAAANEAGRGHSSGTHSIWLGACGQTSHLLFPTFCQPHLLPLLQLLPLANPGPEASEHAQGIPFWPLSFYLEEEGRRRAKTRRAECDGSLLKFRYSRDRVRIKSSRSA